MKPKVHGRRQYLVNKEIQLSYAWLLILCVGIVIVIFGITIWYVMEVCHNMIGEGTLAKNFIICVQNQFLIGTLVSIAIASCVLLILGIFMSHRVAGPLYRITKNLNLLGVENQLDTIQIRKRDQLKEMAEAFNHMVHALKDRMYQDMRLIDQVKSKLSQLHDSLKGESLDIRTLSEQIKEIERLAAELKDRKLI